MGERIESHGEAATIRERLKVTAEAAVQVLDGCRGGLCALTPDEVIAYAHALGALDRLRLKLAISAALAVPRPEPLEQDA